MRRIRVINITTGIIQTAVGGGTAGYGDGRTSNECELQFPGAVTFDEQGVLYCLFSHFSFSLIVPSILPNLSLSLSTSSLYIYIFPISPSISFTQATCTSQMDLLIACVRSSLSFSLSLSSPLLLS